MKSKHQKLSNTGKRMSDADIKSIPGRFRGPKPPMKKLPFAPRQEVPKMKTLPLRPKDLSRVRKPLSKKGK